MTPSVPPGIMADLLLYTLRSRIIIYIHLFRHVSHTHLYSIMIYLTPFIHFIDAAGSKNRERRHLPAGITGSSFFHASVTPFFLSGILPHYVEKTSATDLRTFSNVDYILFPLFPADRMYSTYCVSALSDTRVNSIDYGFSATRSLAVSFESSRCV